MSNIYRYGLRTTSFLALSAAVSGVAFAQASAQSMGQATGESAASEAPSEIVVTGSRIRHNAIDQQSPITFVDQTDIARTGLTSIADVLQRLPSSAGGLNSKKNSSGNLGNPQDGGGVGAGSAEINLRNLSSKRTLVLVDSLRFVNGSSASGIPGSVDLNAIPSAAIERVEVLQDGASAIYGSDAIAGVVNIITKTKQKGFQITAQKGLYGEGDGVTSNYDASYGFHMGSTGTNVVVGGSFTDQKPIFNSQRGFSQFSDPFLTACNNTCSGTTPNGRFIIRGSTLTVIQPIQGPPNVTDYKPFTNSDRFNTAPFNYIQTPYKRYGAFASISQPLADHVELNAKFFFNRRQSANQASPLPLLIGPTAGNGNILDTLTIDATNPFNPFGTLTPSNYTLIARRLNENGPRHYSQKVDTYYGTAGLSGDFQFLGHGWNWDVNGVFGDTHARQIFTGNVNAARVQQALGPVANCTGACVPLNLFGGAGTITPAMLNWIGFTEYDKSMQRIWVGSANVTGTLFDLPAGPLGVAIGYEHRTLEGSSTPDPVIQAGLGADIPSKATAGSYKVDELYGELSIPVLRDVPFFKALDGSFAARYSKYSTSGSKLTFKAGGNWKPVDDLMLRGTYAQGFRAPSIGELFGSLSRFDAPVVDPCNGLDAPGFNQTVKQNCIAHGVPTGVGYTQLNSQLPVLTGGNQLLKPETSRSIVGGAVYSASWARPWARVLSLEASYFNIRVKDAISAVDPATLLGRCENTNEALSCSTITRVGGYVTSIVGTLQNIAGIETEGLDLNFAYRSPTLGFGAIGFSWQNTFTFKYNETSPTATGTAVIRRVGTESGTQGYPKLRSTAVFDWSKGAFSASLTGRYFSAIRESTGTRIGFELGRRLYGDAQLSWTTGLQDRALTFTLGVNNLTGASPPPCYSCVQANYDPSLYDLPGQFFYARVAIKL